MTAKSYKVFISSTFIDNQERRKTVEDAIISAGMLPIGMERFTASTQPAVDECKQKAADCDLLIGIVAWRYGWIPDDSEISITEMEYDAAKNAGKDRLMFLLDENLPVNPKKDYDQDKDKWKKQEKLEAFKKKVSADQMIAYFNQTTLGTRVTTALHNWRQQKEASDSKPTRQKKTDSDCKADPNLDKDIRLYCARAESLHSHLPVAGFVTQLKVPIDIDDIYVPLTASVDLRGFADETFFSGIHAEKCMMGCEDRQTDIALPEAFSQSEKRKRIGIVILGDPGSGKTTHLKRLLMACLRRSTAEIGLPEKMLPVFLPLRDLRDLNGGLDKFIESQFQSKHLGLPKGFGKRMLERGKLLLLFDGLDEVADLAEREQVSKWIIDAVKELPDCRFVVTSRYAGYSDTVRLSEDFLEMHIRPMSADQSNRFIHNWYRAVEVGLAVDQMQGESIAREKSEDLIEKLKQPDFRARRVFELTRNPLLLTNLCLVHRHRGSLPKKRARLYEECIDVLLEHWRGAKGLKIGVDAREGCRALQPAALWLHQEEERTKATAGELAPVLDPALKKIGWEGGGAENFLRTIRDESGLLVGWDQEHYGFMHLGFQEYLAAREIRSKAFSNPEVVKELASHFGESWWEEVALLLLALEDPSLFEPFMREVISLPAFAKNPHLVELCLDDAAEVSIEPFRTLLEKDAGKDPSKWENQFEALRIIQRLDPEIVELLAEKLKNHPYPKVANWILSRQSEDQKRAAEKTIYTENGNVELVCIPGGPFLMGTPDEQIEELMKMRPNYYDEKEWRELLERERPVHPVNIPAFYLSRFPVTNQEYGQFLADNPEAKEPKYWGDRNLNKPKLPVVGVNWHEARAFATWADCRIPTEAEWEYACRAGSPGPRYGELDNIAWYRGNSSDSRYGGLDNIVRFRYRGNSSDRTQPVGLKNPNAFGLYDTLGNVWEWCQDHWHENYKGAPQNEQPWIDREKNSARVVRGGGWDTITEFVRASYRHSRFPGERCYDGGFRIAQDYDSHK